MKKYYGLRGSALNWAVGIIAGMDFLLFGYALPADRWIPWNLLIRCGSYDQGVVGGLLTLPVFLCQFPSIDDREDPTCTGSLSRPASALASSTRADRSTYQGISVASYNLGCLFGALITIFIGNPLGRRRTILLGSSVMVVGAILQCSAFTISQFIVGRIITGLGNGMNTSTASQIQPVSDARTDTN